MSTAPGGALSNPATALLADSIAHQSDALLLQNFSLYAQDTWKGIFYDLGSGSLGGVSSYFPHSATKVFSPAPFPQTLKMLPRRSLLSIHPFSICSLPILNLKLPRTFQWNIALEQSLGSSQSLSITYVGVVGRDLLRSTVLNPASAGNPNFLGTDNVIDKIFGHWSLDGFLFIRSAPPVDIGGAQISAGVAVFMPRPDTKPGLPLELYGSQHPGGKVSIQRFLFRHQAVSRGISGAMSSEASQLGKLTWGCRDNFA